MTARRPGVYHDAGFRTLDTAGNENGNNCSTQVAFAQSDGLLSRFDLKAILYVPMLALTLPIDPPYPALIRIKASATAWVSLDGGIAFQRAAVMTAYTSPVLAPSAIPELAVASMNATHREEVELVNALGALLESGLRSQAAVADISATLDAWVQHTRRHFERENQLMQEYAFPAMPVHRGEHARMLGVIESRQRQWLESREVEPLAAFVFRQWPDWFNLHVNTMDRVTAAFISQWVA